MKVVQHYCIAGTAILLKPGIIAGGAVVHDCPVSRSIGYFLEPVIMLAPFAKKPLQLTLRGITTDDQDLSVSPSSIYVLLFSCLSDLNRLTSYEQSRYLTYSFLGSPMDWSCACVCIPNVHVSLFLNSTFVIRSKKEGARPLAEVKCSSCAQLSSK